MLLSFGIGFLAVAIFGGFCFYIFKSLTIEVPVNHEIIITSFGRYEKKFSNPGLTFFPFKALPWVKCFLVSCQRDFLEFSDLQIHDKNGTTMLVDLWIEYRIQDAHKSLFAVEHWEQTLKSVVIHSAMSILSRMACEKIFLNRNDLERQLQHDIDNETKSWGIKVEGALIKNIGLLPEVSKQIIDTVAAKLEHTKAMIEEGGRLVALRLESQTHEQVAELHALAKGAYPLAVGRAYEALKTDPTVFKAYEELFHLSRLQPQRTIAFDGFHLESLKSIDAAMAAAPFLEKSEQAVYKMQPSINENPKNQELFR